MDESQQEHLDAQVQQAMRELQADGEHPTVESVARKVGRRTETVLAAIRRLTGGSPPTPDHDTPPADYPEVLTQAARVARLSSALREAQEAVQEAETTYAGLEQLAAQRLAEGGEALSLVAAREQMRQLAEREQLFSMALDQAKRLHGEALAVAQEQHEAAIWHRFQRLLGAHVTDLHRASASWAPLRQFCAAHNWRFGLAVFNGTMQILEENWIPHAEALLAQTEAGPDGGLPAGSQPSAY